MIIVNRVADSITGSVNGKAFGVAYNPDKYSKMLTLKAAADAASTNADLQTVITDFIPLTVENYKELVEHSVAGKYLFVNNATGEIFLSINGTASTKPLPKSLVERVIYSVEKDIDPLPLVKNWARFLRNPLYSDKKAANYAQYINTTVVNEELKNSLIEEQGLSVEVATARATMYDVSFTQEGLLVTYKVVKEIDWKFVADSTSETIDADGNIVTGVKKVDRFDFEVDEFTGIKKYVKPSILEQRVFEPAVQGTSGDSFFSSDYSGHIIRVGQVTYLDSWDKVNCNDSQSCVKGLHVGGLRYIKNYQNDNTLTLNVFVDPMYIGGIDHQGTGALRVLKFFPHSALEGITQNLYHSSEYAKMTDSEYATLIQEAVDLSSKKIDDINADLAEKQLLQ